jgi:hypothetical protein
MARPRRLRQRRRPSLYLEQILKWADEHHARTGQWPTESSGPILDAPEETWKKVDGALRGGFRGLLGDSSLPQLLLERRGVAYSHHQPSQGLLSQDEILIWADEHHARTGQWPVRESGAILDNPEETWRKVDGALRGGFRGLPGNSSLPQLLFERRGVPYRRHSHELLSEEEILAWADEHFARTGDWPAHSSGPVGAAPGETWSGLAQLLSAGGRGLSGGSSLARLLAEHRHRRNPAALPRLTVEQILAWADAHREQTGKWPSKDSGPMFGEGETWLAVDSALRYGQRGLSGSSSLSQLLARARGVRNLSALPLLSIEQILAWSDAFFRCTGQWPRRGSGVIPESEGETWALVDSALVRGLRGLPQGLSLARLLARERGYRNKQALPPLTEAQILQWADRHFARSGAWPTRDSGPIPESAGEVWANVDAALKLGLRTLSGGSSLANLLCQQRGHPHRGRPIGGQE